MSTMAVCRRVSLPECYRILRLNFSTSCFLTNKWRIKQGLEREPRQFGPLTNLPDYSFVDGRPVPLSYHKYQKVKLQEKFCEKIVTLCHELDVGLANYHEKQKQIKLERENILKNKLIPKGEALLPKKSGKGKS